MELEIAKAHERIKIKLLAGMDAENTQVTSKDA